MPAVRDAPSTFAGNASQSMKGDFSARTAFREDRLPFESAKPTNGWLTAALSIIIGLAVAWFFFYLIGRLLILIPPNLHDRPMRFSGPLFSAMLDPCDRVSVHRSPACAHYFCRECVTGTRENFYARTVFTVESPRSRPAHMTHRMVSRRPSACSSASQSPRTFFYLVGDHSDPGQFSW